MTPFIPPTEPHATRRSTFARIVAELQNIGHHLAVIATAEAKAIGVRVGIGSALFVLAVVGVSLSFLFFSLAIWWWLGLLIGNALSGLIIGVVWLIGAGALLVVGAKVIVSAAGFPETSSAISDITARLSDTATEDADYE